MLALLLSPAICRGVPRDHQHARIYCGKGFVGVQVAQQEHVRAFYDEDDPSKQSKTFANAVFTIPSNSKEELAPFEGPRADLLPCKARLHRLERGGVVKVRPGDLAPAPRLPHVAGFPGHTRLCYYPL